MILGLIMFGDWTLIRWMFEGIRLCFNKSLSLLQSLFVFCVLSQKPEGQQTDFLLCLPVFWLCCKTCCLFMKEFSISSVSTDVSPFFAHTTFRSLPVLTAEKQFVSDQCLVPGDMWWNQWKVKRHCQRASWHCFGPGVSRCSPLPGLNAGGFPPAVQEQPLTFKSEEMWGSRFFYDFMLTL